uniref:COPI associated protein n=1 Tax=Chromera velia CCMP2878 TaxID=1169474 RepID=A0A0G4F3B0_9ALVE|mmetsp:Transcript_29171/g.57194  ORF Transcript_29171/g.57194 Transcript_29171/m.57194 type:complete len:184 (+) Transcript_29171:186-737(+)|eukprot:Cvel_2689.t1-p1 / transcript=Cvel_2689.t1 / gene=Cvel_2689 / organism=Chromera_velia_CCMP2878 / gene_product=hypothetical protein / transcript_product=hypothetical protein / location=Cvel_scaffold107:115802-120463(+) / protein_length=183 / sequence_SO=supercontig / SO=protein_coding / is_pseudo=false
MNPENQLLPPGSIKNAAEATIHAGDDMRRKTLDWWDKHRRDFDGPIGLRVLAVIGGFALCVVAVLDLLSFFGILFDLTGKIMHVYLLLGGLCVLCFEAVDLPCSCLTTLREYLEVWARFLTVSGGRGLFYVFLGVFSFACSSWLDKIVGLYMLAVGVVICIQQLVHLQKIKSEDPLGGTTVQP